MARLPLPTARAVYEDWHARRDADNDATRPWHLLIQKHLDPKRDLLEKRVLEIGCGRGEFSCWLARQPNRPVRIVASDFADTALRKGVVAAREQNLSGISWELSDIQMLPFRDETFDTVFSCETVEHVPEPARAVEELARVLKPGGRLFLTTPNYFGVYGLYRAYLRLVGRRYTELGQPINNFTWLPRTRYWVSRAGLRAEVTDGVGHFLLFPGRLPREIPALDNPRVLMRWFGLQSLVVAEKVRNGEAV